MRSLGDRPHLSDERVTATRQHCVFPAHGGEKIILESDRHDRQCAQWLSFAGGSVGLADDGSVIAVEHPVDVIPCC